MKTLRGWGGVAYTSRDPPQEVLSSSVGAWQTWSMKRDVPNYRGYLWVANS